MPSNYITYNESTFSNGDFDSIYATEDYLLDIFSGDSLLTSGYNTYGQLAQSPNTHRSSPIQVGSLTD